MKSDREGRAPVCQEGVLEEHPRVQSCAAVGLPDEDMGARIQAIVQAKGVVDESELHAHLADRLVTYKIPPSFKFDHSVIARDGCDTRQRVIETTGGSPLPGDFVVDYADQSDLRTPPDPSYPHQVAGVARLNGGLAIGGVRHQFRQEGDGMRALLTVEFPGRVPRRLISQHQWHLAVGFSNWIDSALASGRLRSPPTPTNGTEDRG